MAKRERLDKGRIYWARVRSAPREGPQESVASGAEKTAFSGKLCAGWIAGEGYAEPNFIRAPVLKCGELLVF